MNEDHDAIEELLAGYAMLGLTGRDADEADRRLSEHVPTCPTCREALSGFQAVVGELALAVPPTPPPDLLLPRIERELAEAPRRRARGAPLVALAASVVALVGLAGLSLSLGNRVSKVESQRGSLAEALALMQQPNANPVSLQGQGTSSGGLVEISGPDVKQMYIVGHGVPDPAPGDAYQLWLGSGGTFTAVGDMFVPEQGLVVLELTFDPLPYDTILITEEVAGPAPATPGSARWSADLAPAA